MTEAYAAETPKLASKSRKVDRGLGKLVEIRSLIERSLDLRGDIELLEVEHSQYPHFESASRQRV